MTPDSTPFTHEPNPPALGELDRLVFDEPGRCGHGLDSHAFHYRLVYHCGFALLIRHGGGDERIRISHTEELIAAMTAMDSSARYWIFNAIFHAHDEARENGRDRERATWQQAAAEHRIKTRKLPKQGIVKVWIETKAEASA